MRSDAPAGPPTAGPPAASGVRADAAGRAGDPPRGSGDAVALAARGGPAALAPDCASAASNRPVLDRLLAAIAWARRLPGWVRFAAAAAFTAAAALAALAAFGAGEPRALFALLPPVLAAGLLFTRPAGALAIDDPRDLAAAAVFLAVALGVAWLVEALHASLVRHAAAEARWRGLVEVLPGFTWTAAPDGRLDWTSPGWHAYAGECGGDWQAHIHPADRARVLEGWAAAVAARAPGHEDEVRLRAADGTYRWFLARAVPVRRHGGGGAAAGAPPPRWVGTCTDVDERRRAEERRRVLVDELNHRVKNTLSVVQSLARQTARGAASPAAFVPASEARLFALSAAHDLLTRRDWAGATVAELAAAVLAPHLPAGRVALSGPQALHLGTRGAVARWRWRWASWRRTRRGTGRSPCPRGGSRCPGRRCRPGRAAARACSAGRRPAGRSWTARRRRPRGAASACGC
jgi:PAS domain-containing protein